MSVSNTRSMDQCSSEFREEVMPRGAEIRGEQTELIYTQAPVALLAAFAVALMITVGLWRIADHTILSIWIGAQLLQTLIRLAVVICYRRSNRERQHAARWSRLFLAGALVSGIIWGCIGLIIDFSWAVEYQVLIIMGLAGVLAGAISCYAVLFPVFVAFMTPTILIPAQSMLIQSNHSQNVLGILFIVFAGALLVIARNYNRNVLHTLSLRHENRELVERTTAANAILENEVRERRLVEAELRRDRRLFTRGPVTVFRWRADDGWPIEHVSRTVSQYGYEADELMEKQRSFASLIHPSDLQRVEESEFSDADDRSAFLGIDYRLMRADGEIRWVYDYTIPLRDEHGKVTHYAGYLLDITERKQGEFELQQEKERAQITLHSISDAVITTDVNGQIEYLNPTAEQMTGWESGFAQGLPLSRVFSLFDESSRANVQDPVSRSLEARSVVKSRHDCVLQRNDGRKFSIQYSASPILGRKDNPLGVVLVCHDVTENRNMAKKLSYQAKHDALTGLINRHEFEARLEYALESTRKEQGKHILCYLDLDQFKVVNDTCGHTEGDNLLRELAQLLPGCLRESDVLARLGGDEFGILLKNCTAEPAMDIAGKILAAIREFRYVSQGKTFEFGASIGLAQLDGDSDSVEEVMSAADMACFAAKDLGRNRIHLYESGDEDLARQHNEMQWVTRVTDAINSDRLTLYCQDIVPVIPGRGDGRHFEILLRLLDEEGRLVPPDRFLPAAERYNLIATLDRWVITRSFIWYSHHAGNRTEPGQLIMSINLSVASIADTSLLQFIKDQLLGYSVPPEAICFEITEAAAIANLDNTSVFMHEMHRLGCRFALDDFGSGLGSFGYLKNLPVDYLKIDGMFIRDMVNNPVDFAMVNAIHQLGRAMGIGTIAEFVEDETVLQKLAEIGVDYAQGYGVNRPRELGEVTLSRQQRA